MTKPLNNKELRNLVDNALNLAVAHIQDRLGQNDGGFAGMWFSGGDEEADWNKFVDVLTNYAEDEQRFISNCASEELKEKADLVYTETNDCPTCKDIDPKGMGARYTGTLCPDCEKQDV